MAVCNKTSMTSSLVQPLCKAPRRCSSTSWGRFRAVSMARLIRLRVLRLRPGLVQTAPQQYSVTNSCKGRLKSSAWEMAASTYSAPSTSRRTLRPASNSSLVMVLLLYFLVWTPGARDPGGARSRDLYKPFQNFSLYRIAILTNHHDLTAAANHESVEPPPPAIPAPARAPALHFHIKRSYYGRGCGWPLPI